MRRLLLAIAIGLVGAGLVHIAVIFLLPTSAPSSAWSRLSQSAEPFQVQRLDDTEILHETDPLFSVAACRFDLRRGPLRLTGSGNVPFWSVAIINSRGQTVWSMNDRNGTEDDLDLMVVSRLQDAEFRREMPPDLASTVFAESNDDEGIAIIRIFHPDESYEPVSDSFMQSISCAPF